MTILALVQQYNLLKDAFEEVSENLREAVDEVLEAAGIGELDYRDELLYCYVEENLLAVGVQNRTGRDTIYLPLTIVNSPDPISSAALWKLDNDVLSKAATKQRIEAQIAQLQSLL